MSKCFYTERGFVGLYLTIIVLILMLGIITSIAFGVLTQHRIIQNTIQSAQSYAAAESGLEDALLRLRRGMSWTSPYTLAVGDATSTVSVSSIIGGARTITGEGDANNRVRKARVVYQLDSTAAALHYGAHIGEGGLHLAHNNAEIIGNVFSNGNVTGVSSSTRIANSLIVASSTNSVSTITVGENAEAYSCSGATITGDLEYNSGGSNTCSVGGSATATSTVIATQEFAITQEMIDDWKDDAEAGGIIAGNYTISSDETLGPVKIDGDLHIDNNRKLTLNGTIWVTGNFTSNPNAIIELGSDYGDLSGVMVADGIAHVKNNLVLQGSGDAGSFLLFASLSSSTDPANPAIEVRNNADNAILFAPNGLLAVENNADVVEVLAHRLEIRNAIIEYDVGLADARFTSGPGGGWIVSSWKEIE